MKRDKLIDLELKVMHDLKKDGVCGAFPVFYRTKMYFFMCFNININKSIS